MTLLGVCLLSGLLSALAFPPAGLWPLAFVALAPLFSQLRGRSTWQGAAMGLAVGWTAALIAGSWVAATSSDIFVLGPVGAVAFAVAIHGYVALPYALAGALIAWGHRHRTAFDPWLAAAAVSLADGLRVLLQPIPWLLPGQALGQSSIFAQASEVVGALGLGFVATLAAGYVTRGAQRRSRRDIATALAMAALLASFGLARRASLDETAGALSLRIGLVQPGGIAVLGGPRPPVEAYVALTQQALETGAQLVLWPETTLVGEPSRFSEALAPLYEALAHRHAAVLVGGLQRAGAGVGNTAFLLTGSGSTPVYTKRRLVPFGEYVPEAWLRFAPLAAWASATFGDVQTVAAGTSQPPVEWGAVTLEPLICQEVAYDDLVRDAAQLITVLSNDSWARGAGTARLVELMARLRAIESRRVLARAAYPGGSAVFDLAGREVARLEYDEVGTRVVEVALARPSRLDLRWLVPWWIVGVSIARLAWNRRTSKPAAQGAS